LISTLRFLINFSRNSQHFRIPTQPVILVVNGQFSDFYSAVIIRQGLFSPSVQPLFDLVLTTWSHVVRSRDFSVPAHVTELLGPSRTFLRDFKIKLFDSALSRD